jgi:hypothetical protein
MSHVSQLTRKLTNRSNDLAVVDASIFVRTLAIYISLAAGAYRTASEFLGSTAC